MENPDRYYDELALVAGSAYQKRWDETLSCERLIFDKASTEGVEVQPLQLIPYYSWDNCEAGYMKVWFDRIETDALYHS